MKKLIIAISLFSFLSNNIKSQSIAACNAAQPVCSNPNFMFTSSTGNGLTSGLNISNPGTNPQMGNGNNPLAPANSGCHFANSPGPQWLLLTISSTGTLGFSFGQTGSANPQAGFYDWAMWPYSPTACAGIFGNTLPPVSCNWNASSTGGTGMGPTPPGGVAGNYQPALNVTAGQQFLILISNYSGVNTAVTFSSTGSAGISCNPFVIPPKTICAGSSAVLSGTTSLTGASATITPGGNVSIGSAINFTMSPTTTTNYTITLTGNDPNTSAVTTVTTATSINVITSSVAINSASTVCQAGSVNLTSQSTGTNVAYSWSGPAGYSSSTQNPVLSNLMPSSSGIYTVTASITNGTLVCTATNTTDITVIPVAQVTVNPASITVCQGTPFSFSAGAPGAASYLWNGPGSFSTTSQTPGFANSGPQMSGNYVVTANFSANNVVCTTTNAVAVTVNPIISFTLAPQPNVCPNSVLVIPGPVGATSYTWNGPTGFVGNGQNAIIPNVNSGYAGTYTCDVVLNGCPSSASVDIAVLSPIVFTQVPSNRTICQGDTVHCSNQVTGGSGVYNIVWGPGTGLNPPYGHNTVAQPAYSTYYTISANDVACPSQYITTNFVITVNPLPQPNVVASKVEGCVPLCVDLVSGSSPQAVSVHWNFGHNLNASGDNTTFCFQHAGTYSIITTITDINGCTSQRTAPFTIEAYPRPGPDFWWEPTEVTYIDNVANFSSSSQSGSITSYFWDFGDMVNNPGTNNAYIKNPKHEYSELGNYPVTVIMTNAWGCVDTLIKALQVSEDFTMYIPNAFTPNGDGINDLFQPKGMGWKPEQYEFLIYDRWGNLIFKTNDYSVGWDGTIKGAKAPTDVYVYKIKAVSSAHSDRKDFAGHVTLIK